MHELGSRNYSTTISNAFGRSSPARWIALSLAATSTLFAGCPANPEPTTDGSVPSIDAPGADVPLGRDAGPPGCISDADCADAIDCTTDSCVLATGSCRHVITPALCTAGESCNPITGCEPGRPCAIDGDCEDDNACTTMERCDPAARVCTYRPLDGDGDGDPPRGCGGGDCDDSEMNAYAGAPEQCNSVDDDCDGRADESYRLDSDPEHCGGCSVVCHAGGCVGGECTCASGLTLCMTRPGRPGPLEPLCVDASTDPWNCGGCGRVCPPLASSPADPDCIYHSDCPADRMCYFNRCTALAQCREGTCAPGA